jgi:hypothetical protein
MVKTYLCLVAYEQSWHLNWGSHPADKLDVSPQVVHAREDVSALETRMAFFLVEFAKSSRLNAYKRQDVNARLGAGGGGVDQITPSTKVTLYC